MTTITVSSFKTYNRIHNYLYNKNIECWETSKTSVSASST